MCLRRSGGPNLASHLLGDSPGRGSTWLGWLYWRTECYSSDCSSPKSSSTWTRLTPRSVTVLGAGWGDSLGSNYAFYGPWVLHDLPCLSLERSPLLSFLPSLALALLAVPWPWNQPCTLRHRDYARDLPFPWNALLPGLLMASPSHHSGTPSNHLHSSLPFPSYPWHRHSSTLPYFIHNNQSIFKIICFVFMMSIFPN